MEEVWEEESYRFTYDASGLKTKMTNTLGKETFYLYNELRQPVLTIKPIGAVVELKYNRFNQVEATHKYKNKFTRNIFNILWNRKSTSRNY